MPDIDYDVPRKASVDLAEESLDELKERRRNAQSPDLDVDGEALADLDDFPAVDTYLDEGELTVAVLPMQTNEFRCSRCFLVHNRSQLAPGSGPESCCQDCA